MHLRCLADSRSKYHHQQNGCGHWATADVDIIEIMIRGCECCRRVSSSLWSVVVVVVVVATVVWCCVIVVVVHPRTRCCHHRNGLAIGPDPALTVSRMRVLGARKAIVIIIIGCHVVVAIPVNPDQCELLKKRQRVRNCEPGGGCTSSTAHFPISSFLHHIVIWSLLSGLES